ncbi:MAG TPA: TIGR04141 family sporadically distributed protein [bacterium]|nr:TIGR04141 family sporadically distributed protein [bacterium]
MGSTAKLKIYGINTEISLLEIKTLLESEGYSTINIRNQPENFEVFALKKGSSKSPDWYNFILPEIQQGEAGLRFYKYSFICLISHEFTYIKTTGESETILHKFAITGGSGHSSIFKHVDCSFGISILEKVFDEEKNKITSIAEKQIIGDVLASRRFYRRARQLAYEDDFGKCFKDVSVKIEKGQIREYFPSIAHYKGASISDQITVTGASNIEIATKITFPVLLELLKDISRLIVTESQPLFNTTLQPLLKKNAADFLIIQELINEVKIKLTDYLMSPENFFDLDFSHINFESFFSSDTCTFKYKIPNSSEELTYVENDLWCSSHGSKTFHTGLTGIMNNIRGFADGSLPNKRNIAKSVVENVIIYTENDSEKTTEGTLFDYIHFEFNHDGKTYFYLDGLWYKIKEAFDTQLIEKYSSRIITNFNAYNFIKTWPQTLISETEYNEQYNNPPSSIYLHEVFVDNVELADAIVDIDDITYILHVKKGVGATIRDLTSQAYISARIIEEQCLNTEKTQLKAWYNRAVERNRLNQDDFSVEDFLSLFSQNRKRVYCLGIYDNNQTPDRISTGNFTSRIAKFSLIEFAGIMNANGWKFSISEIKEH